MPDQTLLRKYFEHACTAEEEKIVLQYLAEGNGEAFELLLQNAWDEVPATDIGPDITNRMLLNIEKATYDQPKAWWMQWQRIAAILLTAITIAGITWRVSLRKTPALTWATAVNTNHQPKLIVLPDSTRIWLSPQSRVTYTVFTGHEKERSLRLEGEAFFDVVQNEDHPFVVYTGPVATQVLGTSFNVEAYSNEQAVRVSLVNGAVAIVHTDSTGHITSPMATLAPGDMLHYNKTDRHFRTEKIRITDPADWTNGSLVFNDVPLTDAVQRVAARNGVNVRFTGKTAELLKNRRLTAIFREESTTAILNNMLFISGCHIVQKGTNLEIHAMP